MTDKHADAVRFFKAIPWCAAFFERPDLVLFTPSSRLEGPDGSPASKDKLMRKSLHASDSVPHCIGFYQDDTKATASTADNGSSSDAPSSPRLLTNSVCLIYDLQPGVSGYHGSVHGGFFSVLADEAMGSLIYQNFFLQKQKQEDPKWRLPPGTLDLMNVQYFTASMNTRLQKPLPTPSVIAVTASLSKVQGRKMFVSVAIENEKGVRFATCEGLWISLPAEKI